MAATGAIRRERASRRSGFRESQVEGCRIPSSLSPQNSTLNRSGFAGRSAPESLCRRELR